MSSYLNIYLVPRKEHIPEQKPLYLMQWSRNSEMYQVLKTAANPTYIGTGDKIKYSDLTVQNIDTAIRIIQDNIAEWKKRINARVEVINQLKNPTREILDDYIQDNMEDNAYVEELQDTLNELQSLHNIISDLQYSDFEKAVCNYDN